MKFYQTSLLNKHANVVHSFTTKNVGNLAFHVNDDIDNVTTNHDNLAKKLHYDKNKLIHMKQIHSNIVHVVTNSDKFDNPPTCDALITNKVDTPLMVMVADCSPMLFFDPIQKVIAVAHAGRAGAFTNIVQNVINAFINDFSCETKNVIVSVGASIGSCCYEVGEEIYFEAKRLNLDFAIEKKDDFYHLDIRNILKKQLIQSGVKKNNIEISNECNRCLHKNYFSYRENRITGRFAGVIKLH